MKRRFIMTPEEQEEWKEKLEEFPGLAESFCGLKFYGDGFGFYYIETFKTMWLKHSQSYIRCMTRLKNGGKPHE
jgi:hypothetical protein